MTFYHATPIDRVHRILREGLRPSRSLTTGCLRPRRPHVYLWCNLEDAVLFCVGTHWNHEMAILEVEVPNSWLEAVPVSELPPVTPEPKDQWRVGREIPPSSVVRVWGLEPWQRGLER